MTDKELGRNEVELENGEVVAIDDYDRWVWLKTSPNDIEEDYGLVDIPTDAVRFIDDGNPPVFTSCDDPREEKEFEIPRQQFEEDAKEGKVVPKEYYDQTIEGERPEGFSLL